MCKDEEKPIQKGDILYFSSDKETAHHATIISDVKEDTIFFSSHSEPFLSKNIIDGLADLKGGTFYIIRINDKNI